MVQCGIATGSACLLVTDSLFLFFFSLAAILFLSAWTGAGLSCEAVTRSYPFAV
jgi:hypothetical protein